MNTFKKKRLKSKLTQKELAELTGVNLYTIQNIEQGKRKGSEETIKILNEYFDNFHEESPHLSTDSEDLIKELEEDIFLLGEDEVLYAMFEIKSGKLFITDYDFANEPLVQEDIDAYDLIVELKAKDVLKFLKIQNRLF